MIITHPGVNQACDILTHPRDFYFHKLNSNTTNISANKKTLLFTKKTMPRVSTQCIPTVLSDEYFWLSSSTWIWRFHCTWRFLRAILPSRKLQSYQRFNLIASSHIRTNGRRCPPWNSASLPTQLSTFLFTTRSQSHRTHEGFILPSIFPYKISELLSCTSVLSVSIMQKLGNSFLRKSSHSFV